MVSVQKAAWLSVVLANDASTARTIEPQSIPEGKGDIGQSDLLDWDLYRSKSSMQSLLDHLISPFV